jgi:hypothetical protein
MKAAACNVDGCAFPVAAEIRARVDLGMPDDSLCRGHALGLATRYQQMADAVRAALVGESSTAKYPHYFKAVPFAHVDIYRVLLLFGVTDPCLQHAGKKVLVTGGRGAKEAAVDVQEAIDSLLRWQQMRREEAEIEAGTPADGGGT